MKKIFNLVLAMASLTAYGQIKEGEVVPEMRFTTILNAPVRSAALSQLRGKAVLLEFWGTWCGSCIEAMPHLKKLQEKYAGALQVITVSDETPTRIGQYLAVRPSNLWFAVDTAGAAARVFPHQLVPHTVLISPQGKLVATTAPESITESVVDSVLRGETVHPAPKKDLVYSSLEGLLAEVFPTTDTIRQRVIVDGAIPGAPGLSTQYALDPVWRGRRLSAINCTIANLYRIAYGDFPYERTVDKTGTDRNSPQYRIDLIVEKPADLLPALRAELAKRFDVRARRGWEMRDVYLLRVADSGAFGRVPLNSSGKRTYDAGHDHIDQQAISMKDFAAYLESYGVGIPVIDETGDNRKYDIHFQFQPENPQSLTNVLAGMGLRLMKERRDVEILVLSKE